MGAQASRSPVLEVRPQGIYCPAGDFFIDPWQPVDDAVITHAHSDHARWGCRRYLCSHSGLAPLRTRLGNEISVESLEYGEKIQQGSAMVSLHPAGHILGSAQVRVEVNGEVWVVTGDYKTEVDETCVAWESVRCHGFVTETTFGLPDYRWATQSDVFAEIAEWHQQNVAEGRTSVLTAYALGKAQRLIAGLRQYGIHFVVHGSVASMNRVYEAGGVDLGHWRLASESGHDADAMVVCPPSAVGTPWMRRFGEASVAFASGWMAVRGIRRRRGVDRGFVLSDHVDWPSLMGAVDASRAERVWTTHGYADAVARYLREERGLDAQPLQTQFGGEESGDA